jgi:hypothetical protein
LKGADEGSLFKTRNLTAPARRIQPRCTSPNGPPTAADFVAGGRIRTDSAYLVAFVIHHALSPRFEPPPEKAALRA